MILTKKEIEEKIINDDLIKISDFNGGYENCKNSKNYHYEKKIQGASYDLGMGSQCFVSSYKDGNNQKLHLTKENDSIEVPSNSILFFQTYEKICLPNNIAGRVSLRMGLISKGIMMPNQPQIDPGFKNHIYGMLYNLSTKSIRINLEEHIVSIEFYKLTENTNPYSENDGYSTDNAFSKFISQNVTTVFTDLDSKIRDADTKFKWHLDFFRLMSFVIGIFAISLTLIGLYKTINGQPLIQKEVRIFQNAPDEIKNIMSEIDSIKEVHFEKLKKFEVRINELEKELKIRQK